MSRGESWAFERYKSTNEVWIVSDPSLGSGSAMPDHRPPQPDRRRLARDVQLLEDAQHAVYPMKPRTLRDRMGSFSCYATVLLFGPLVQDTIESIREAFAKITVFQRAEPETLLWSFSELEGGGIVRVAGAETEAVKDWLAKALAPLVAIVGAEAYSKVFV